MSKLRDAAQQALEALDRIYSPLHVREINKVGAAMVALRAALAEQPAEQEPVQDEYNRVINHAIEQGIEASVFLSCWQEGDWSGCAEFGFEPNMAAYTAPQPRKRLTDEDIDRALQEANVPELPHGYESVELEIARAIEAAVWGEKT